jgi:hypothetical protein
MAKKNEPKKRIVESKYNPTLLRQLVEEGADAKTAKETLGLASLQSLRTHLMRLSVESQNLMTLPGLYERSSSRVRLTKNGIKVTPKKLESIEGDFPINSEFTVEIDQDNKQIVLTLVTATGQNSEEEPTASSTDES